MAGKLERTEEIIAIESLRFSGPRVDHVGMRTVDEADYELTVATLTRLLGEGVSSPAEGHQRTFFNLTAGADGPRLEVQLWEMPERRKPGVHIDMQTDEPMNLLNLLGAGAEDWGVEETPRGGIAISPHFMVMARQRK